ncbi:DUF3027 domain-containing protein [Microbacterium sp. JZ31]|uniref:DUF3027 domain-containing protein n=1 Tax=Microbacterium sp. JZ31 TaxID=1906274 RepID=UPI001EE3E391|nr:DUF3027 domain-containing protein [Microbacterium sp. JZ31]
MSDAHETPAEGEAAEQAPVPETAPAPADAEAPSTVEPEGADAETAEVEVEAPPVEPTAEETDASDAEEAESTADEASEPVGSEPEELPEPDRRLIEAHDLALAALHEITPASTVGEPAGYSVERDGVVSLRFANTLLGYPGWFWTVSLAVVEGSEPTVLEAELLPGDDALLAPSGCRGPCA